ncbi:MAG TPA: aminotransferase class I/II-fold pyridoxal phosphate-dependent enzyme, partial [Vicinamibacterales bacterium]|nr:aminotransferase class I/II-fold pyridoxal phosphate-dependent enzyme [Vicinamibacterales bacterium]
RGAHRAMKKHPDTDVLHSGEGARGDAAPLTTPIYSATTFLFASAAELEAYQRGQSGKYIYSRYANPTVQAAEAKLAVLEGAEAAMITSSGMAATATALFGLLSAGDEVVCSSAIYGGTLQVISNFLERFGVRARYASLDDLAAPERLCGPATKIVWFESPINPTLRCVDVARVASACRAAGVIAAIDNTFASPINQQPLALGVDLVMHSATKYLNGHSDVTAGALVGSAALIERLQPARKLFGGVLEPASAYALARGMKTLGVRMARHNDNARRVAEWLESDPRVGRVFYPGLPSHPDHAIATRQMRGFGGMVCADLKGGYDAACRFFDKLQIIQRAASLGGTESLCSLPVLTSQYGLSDEQLAAAGVSRGMVRLSIGLEHVEDLIGDIDQALGR